MKNAARKLLFNVGWYDPDIAPFSVINVAEFASEEITRLQKQNEIAVKALEKITQMDMGACLHCADQALEDMRRIGK